MIHVGNYTIATLSVLGYKSQVPFETSQKLYGNLRVPTPQCHLPPEIAGLIKGLLPSLKLTAKAPRNGMVGIVISYWDGLFSGANLLLVSGGVQLPTLDFLGTFVRFSGNTSI